MAHQKKDKHRSVPSGQQLIVRAVGAVEFSPALLRGEINSKI
jgi:hypothetical protein